MDNERNYRIYEIVGLKRDENGKLVNDLRTVEEGITYSRAVTVLACLPNVWEGGHYHIEKMEERA